MKDLVIDHPQQVWVCDITAIALADGSEVYLAIIMAVFTRKIAGWALRRDLTHELSLSALLRALRAAIPEIHHSDQGVQYADHRYIHYLDQAHVRISMAAVGKAWENGYAERVLGTIKQEEVALSEYRTFADALRQLGHFTAQRHFSVDAVYNHKRIHSALGYLTPLEFEAEWLAQTTVNHIP